jgi:hypothetical protein
LNFEVIASFTLCCSPTIATAGGERRCNTPAISVCILAEVVSSCYKTQSRSRSDSCRKRPLLIHRHAKCHDVTTNQSHERKKTPRDAQGFAGRLDFGQIR